MPLAQSNPPSDPQAQGDAPPPTVGAPHLPHALVQLATRMREQAAVGAGLGAEQRAALLRLGDTEAVARFGEINGAVVARTCLTSIICCPNPSTTADGHAVTREIKDIFSSGQDEEVARIPYLFEGLWKTCFTFDEQGNWSADGAFDEERYGEAFPEGRRSFSVVRDEFGVAGLVTARCSNSWSGHAIDWAAVFGCIPVAQSGTHRTPLNTCVLVDAHNGARGRRRINFMPADVIRVLHPVVNAPIAVFPADRRDHPDKRTYAFQATDSLLDRVVGQGGFRIFNPVRLFMPMNFEPRTGKIDVFAHGFHSGEAIRDLYLGEIAAWCRCPESAVSFVQVPGNTVSNHFKIFRFEVPYSLHTYHRIYELTQRRTFRLVNPEVNLGGFVVHFTSTLNDMQLLLGGRVLLAPPNVEDDEGTQPIQQVQVAPPPITLQAAPPPVVGQQPAAAAAGGGAGDGWPEAEEIEAAEAAQAEALETDAEEAAAMVEVDGDEQSL
jgi:hypothetical protein